jgi:hypothetical protein
MEFMARLVLPQILSEDFADYETLMADMEEDPTPLTLPCIPEIAPDTPRSIAIKRTRGIPTQGTSQHEAAP